MKPKLYLMLGYPGAGKTTVAEVIAEHTGAVHLNSDRLRLRAFNPPQFNEAEHASLYATLDYLTEIILQSGKSVVYDANLNKYAYRQEKYKICRKAGAEPVLVWVKTDQQAAKRRATVEAEQNPVHRPFGNMDSQMFDRLVSELEQPRSNEKTIEVYGINLGKDSIIKAIDEP